MADDNRLVAALEEIKRYALDCEKHRFAMHEGYVVSTVDEALRAAIEEAQRVVPARASTVDHRAAAPAEVAELRHQAMLALEGNEWALGPLNAAIDYIERNWVFAAHRDSESKREAADKNE